MSHSNKNQKILHEHVDKNHHIITIPKGHVWLQGDNKPASLDSRAYGPVSLGLVLGRVAWKIWPLTQFGRIKRIDFPEDLYAVGEG